MKVKKIKKQHILILLIVFLFVISVGLLLNSQNQLSKNEIIMISTEQTDCKKVLVELAGKKGKDLDASLSLWQVQLECYSRERQYDKAIIVLDQIERVYDSNSREVNRQIDIQTRRAAIEQAKNSPNNPDIDDTNSGRQDDGSYLGP